MRVPDIEDGYLVLGIGAANQWASVIQSAFVRDGSIAWLGHEARHENVMGVNSDDCIFSQPSESTAILSQNTCYMIRTGASVTRVPFFRRGRDFLEVKKWGGVAVSQDREIEKINFNVVVERLRDQTLSFPNLFMSVDLPNGTIISPVKYLNFPQSSGNYLQFMTGRVLYFDQDWQLCYIAAHSHAGDEWHIEICRAAPVNNLTGRPWGKKSKMIERFRCIPFFGKFMTTHDFSEVSIENGSVYFFQYV